MSERNANRTLKTLLFIGIFLVFYGYISRSLGFYFFWESKFVGWLMLFIASIIFLFYRIKARRKSGKKTLLEKVVITLLIFIVLIQTVFLIVVYNSDAYRVAREFVYNDQAIKVETGGVKGISLVPYGTISSATVEDGEAGNAEIHLVIKGDKKYIDILIFLVKQKDGQWKISGVEWWAGF